MKAKNNTKVAKQATQTAEASKQTSQTTEASSKKNQTTKISKQEKPTTKPSKSAWFFGLKQKIKSNGIAKPTAYLTKIAMLVAMSTVLYNVLAFRFLPPPFDMFKLDFAEVPVLLGGFALGPMAVVIIEVVKVVIGIMLGGLSFGGVGDLSNLVVNLAFVVPAAIFYKYFKTKKGGLLAMLIGTASLVLVSSLTNYFIMLPLVAKFSPVYMEMRGAIVGVGVGFNLLKALVNSTITFLLYKRLSPILKFDGTRKNGVLGFHKVSGKHGTEALARRLARELVGGEIILLDGDLGAGKTTFTQYLFRALGTKAVVTSPTFTIMKRYQGDKFKLYHFDLYRLDDVRELEELGFDEFIGEEGSISVIEWNKIDQLSGKIYTIKFERTGDSRRNILISKRAILAGDKPGGDSDL